MSSTTFLEPMKKILFTFANFFMWSCAIHSAAFIVIGVMMTYIACMRCFLQRYEDQYNGTWGKWIAKESSRESTIIAYAKVTNIYRQIQLLSQAFNEIHQEFVLTASILSAIAIQTILLYNLVCMEFNIQTIPYLLLFLVLLLDLIVIIIYLYGMMGELNRDSKNRITNMLLKRDKKMSADAWLKRLHRSCQPLKVKFGSANWLEPVTPLNIENFVISQTVNLLLLK